MDHLVHVEQKEIIIDFELGRKCKTTLHVRNLMHTMPVAFKLQTTSPHKFCVRPPNGYIPPLSELVLDIILKPQQELPPSFPFSPEKFVLKTALAHLTNKDSVLLERVPNEWFSSPQTRVFLDAKLKVVYIGASLLWHCVAREDEHAVKEMLGRGLGPSMADEDGRTALHIAASIGNFKLVDMLLECGAQVNAMDVNGRTPLWEAVCRGHVTVVKELLKSGACLEINEALKRGCVAPIHIAATLTSTAILEQLIESGANLEKADQEGRTALHFAIESERQENLRVLLRAGADKNAQRGDGRTPLLIAAENGLLEVVHLLLEGGVHAHSTPENVQGNSASASERGHMIVNEALKAGEELLRAARQGDVEAVATLLQHRAGKRTWVKDSAGWTPLHVAAFKGHVPIVRRLLLEEGGRTALQVGDVEGHTPLHCGAEGGSVEVVELLLAMGADPLAASFRGATPADLANALGFNTIAKLIKHHASISLDNNDYYNHGFNAKRLLHPLHRRSISPGPNLASSSKNSETHKESSASSVRFSTPTKLRQSYGSQQRLPSALNPSGQVPDHTLSYSSRNRQHLTCPRHQASIASEDVKVMEMPASTTDALRSKSLSLVPMPLIAPAMPITELSSTTSLVHVQHAGKNSQILSHNSGIKSLSQDVQNPSVVQSHHSQPRKEEEKNYKIVHPLLDYSQNNLQGSRHQRSPKLPHATVFERVHGSKIELGSSPSSKPTEENLIPVDTYNLPNQVRNHDIDNGNQNQKACQENKSIPNKVAFWPTDMLLKEKQKMNDHCFKEEPELPSVTHFHNRKLSPPLSPIREPAEQSKNISSTTKPLSLDLYTTGSGKGLNLSPITMQMHPTTERLNADVHGPALEYSVSAVQLQYKREFFKSLAFATPRCEAQQQCLFKGMEDLGVGKQSSMASAPSASKIMAHSNAVEGISDSQKLLEDSKPQVILVETSSKALNTPSSMQLQMTVEQNVDLKNMLIDKFAVQSSFTYEGIDTLDPNKQSIPSASPCCKTAGTTTLEDKCVTSFVGQAHPSSRFPEGSPTREFSPSISYSSSAPELRVQSEHKLRLASPLNDPSIQTQKVKRNNSIDTFQAIYSVCKTEKTCKIEDTLSLKPTFKASSSDQNGPAYTPPLRIKQMRKPLSTSILKTTYVLQDTHEVTSEAVPQQQV